MADFLTETSLILAKHDVKVGAYLGDGLMAFAMPKTVKEESLMLPTAFLR